MTKKTNNMPTDLTRVALISKWTKDQLMGNSSLGDPWGNYRDSNGALLALWLTDAFSTDTGSSTDETKIDFTTFDASYNDEDDSQVFLDVAMEGNGLYLADYTYTLETSPPAGSRLSNITIGSTEYILPSQMSLDMNGYAAVTWVVQFPSDTCYYLLTLFATTSASGSGVTTCQGKFSVYSSKMVVTTSDNTTIDLSNMNIIYGAIEDGDPETGNTSEGQWEEGTE